MSCQETTMEHEQLSQSKFCLWLETPDSNYFMNKFPTKVCRVFKI